MESKSRKTEYFMMLPIYLALAIPVCGILERNVSKDITPVFFLCYFLINVIISGLALLFEKEKWDLLFSSVFTVVLMLIFRDRVLSVNMLAALGVALIIYIIRDEKRARFGWGVSTILLLLPWIFTDYTGMPKYVGISFAILTVFSAGMLLKRKMTHYVAILMLLALATLFIPSSGEPMKWIFVKKAIRGVADFTEMAVDEFGYLGSFFSGGGDGYTGYSDSDILGKGVKSRSREDIRLTTRDEWGKLYLKGRSNLDISAKGFTGEEAFPDPYNAWFVSYINALYHAGVDRETAKCFSEVRSMEMEYRYLRTDDIIAPLNMLVVNEELRGGLDRKKGKGFNYKVQYILLDYSSPYLKEVFAGAGNKYKYEDYDVIRKYVKTIYSIDILKIISRKNYERVAGRTEEFGRYLDASMATERMKNLVDDITAGCDNDYEKAKAIEAYLRQYEYSTDTDLSGSDNYVDSFLFDTKKGYCVHFSSSMVLMMRLAGIPARYTVGYYHELDAKDENDMNAGKTVLSSEAHAWPEGYIEGFGWVPFEPTASMESAEDYGWGRKVKEKKEETGDEEEEPGKEPETATPTAAEADTPEADNIENEKSFDREGLKRFIYYIAAILIFLVVLMILIKLISYIRYRMLTPEKKLSYNINRIRKLIDEKILKGEKTASIYDYSDAVDDSKKSEELRRLFDEYYRVRFRGDAPDEKLVEKSYMVWKSLKKRKNGL
ncbi:MAG: hypothetical protein K6E28_00020 [Eubacterium sp.]|nr:hypothetical protein [Eubacterium sp.]